MAISEDRKNTTQHYGAYLFYATVISSDPGTNVVVVAPDGQQELSKLQAIPLGNTVASALGFKEPILPNIGARALCYGARGGVCVLIGTLTGIDHHGIENKNAKEALGDLPGKATFGAGDPILEKVHSLGYSGGITKLGTLNNQLPTDVVQGEKVIANEFGVMLGLFQLMSVLKGSELAQVQCHLLDDLVRIISHNFQHYTALGEHNIFHDGQGLHLEIGLTHDPKEGLGVPQTGMATPLRSAITPVDPKEKQTFFELEDERLKAIERLKIFLGKLGDFINILLVSPANEKRQLDGTKPKIPDRGLLQIKASLDGLLLVRSLRGIVLEKTNWIRVPQRIRTPEDPEGDDGAKLEYTKRTPFEFNDKYNFEGNTFLYYLQLKDYLAYIEEELGYSNFKAHEKDFYINDKYASETPLAGLVYVDPITGTAFQRKRSIIALMPNGGVSMSDAWGSAINMEGGNIYIQPAKDLYLQPMRHIIGKIGGSLEIAAKEELDFSSTGGSLKIKTSNGQYLYSQNSGIVLHADGMPIPEGFFPRDTEKPAEFISGVVLKAPNAAVSSYGMQVYHDATEILVSKSKNIFTKAEQTIQTVAKTSMILNSLNILISSVTGTEIYSKGAVFALGSGSTVLGKKGQTYGIAKAGVIEVPVEGLIDTEDLNKDMITKLNQITDDSQAFDVSKYLIAFREDEDFEKLLFYFLPSERFGLGDSDVIPQTLVQQEGNTFTDTHMLQEWKETPVNGTYPFPGADKRNTYLTAKLNNIEQTKDGDLVNKVTDMTTKMDFGALTDVFENYTISRL